MNHNDYHSGYQDGRNDGYIEGFNDGNYNTVRNKTRGYSTSTCWKTTVDMSKTGCTKGDIIDECIKKNINPGTAHCQVSGVMEIIRLKQRGESEDNIYRQVKSRKNISKRCIHVVLSMLGTC